MGYGDYPQLEDVKKILVVKMRHHGDVLLTSPVFRALKRAMPEAEIDAMLYAETFPMLQGHPDISDFQLYDKKKKGDLKLLWKIRKVGYDLVINLTEGDRGAIVAWVSGAAIRVGFDPEGKGMKGKRGMYTHVVKVCPTPRHTVERQLDAVRRIGIFPTPEERDLIFSIPDEAHQRVAGLLREEELTQPILIHPVSRWRFKCLPTKTIAALIKALQQQGHSVLLSGSGDPVEMAMIQEITSLAPAPSLAGKLSLKELGALIAASRALICVDSVPLHVASATKTPVVALFGPSSELDWGPWRHPHAQVVSQLLPCRPCNLDGCAGSKMSDCLHTLTVGQILHSLASVLSKNSAPVFFMNSSQGRGG